MRARKEELYIIKPSAKQYTDKFKRSYFIDELGYGRCTISNLLNGYRACPKYTAYAITKAIDEKAKVTDFFDRIEV